MKYLLSGCTCSLELTKFTKFINKTYEEKKNTNKTRKVIFHYKLLCLLSPEAHKTKICCFISPLFGWRDEGTPALRNKKSMYISRQFLNSFDISVFTNLAWRNKFYLILSVFATFSNPLTCPKLYLQKATRIAIVRWSRFAILQRIFCVKSCQICHWGSIKTALKNNDYKCCPATQHLWNAENKWNI